MTLGRANITYPIHEKISSVCAPSTLCTPGHRARAVTVKYYVKIWHQQLGVGANNMHPLNLGGGGAQRSQKMRKNSLNYTHFTYKFDF